MYILKKLMTSLQRIKFLEKGVIKEKNVMKWNYLDLSQEMRIWDYFMV